MKYAKKLLCLALALVMSLSLVACSSSGDGKDDGSSPSAGIDHDREVVYGSASLITNFNVKYVTSQNDLQALDQVYDTLAAQGQRKILRPACRLLGDFRGRPDLYLPYKPRRQVQRRHRYHGRGRGVLL